MKSSHNGRGVMVVTMQASREADVDISEAKPRSELPLHGVRNPPMRGRQTSYIRSGCEIYLTPR